MNHQVRSLAKGVAIIELLASESGGLTLAEMSRRLDANRSTTHHLLATLRAGGFVDQNPGTKVYRLGYRLIGLVNEFLSEATVSSLGIGPVQTLRDATGDTTYLSILQGWELFPVFEAPGNFPIQTNRSKRSGQTFLHATASGKTLLAHLPPADIDGLLATVELTRFTPNTITSLAELHDELVEIRVDGHAFDREEFLPGVASIASPVFDRDGTCVATVSVVIPAIQAARLDTIAPFVTNTSEKISMSLGHVSARGSVNGKQHVVIQPVDDPSGQSKGGVATRNEFQTQDS